jgi:hypothetical protein
MDDALCTQFKSSLKWSNCIRKHVPTLIFYCSQTYNQTIVIYYRADDGTIKMGYTKLSVDTLHDMNALPSAMDKFFTLLPAGLNLYTLPGLTKQTPWTLSAEGRFIQGDRVLVSTTGVVNSSTQQIECVYRVYVDKSTRTLEWSREECTEEAKTGIPDFRNVLWTTLKTVIGK